MLTPPSQFSSSPQEQDANEQGRIRKQALSLPAPPVKKRPRFSNTEEENVIFKSLAPSLFLPNLMESMAFDDDEDEEDDEDDKENPSHHLPSITLQPRSGLMLKVCSLGAASLGSMTYGQKGTNSTGILKHHPFPPSTPPSVGFQSRRTNTQHSDQQEVHRRLSSLRF